MKKQNEINPGDIICFNGTYSILVLEIVLGQLKYIEVNNSFFGTPDRTINYIFLDSMRIDYKIKKACRLIRVLYDI
jgi:hypothetical protein